MVRNKDILLCWHAKRAGFGVLIQAIDSLKAKGITISRVLYLVRQGETVLPKLPGKQIELEVVHVDLSGPTHHANIYNQLKSHVLPLLEGAEGNLHINVSPGTPAMHAVWLILHSGGSFPPGTRLWSSQYDRESERTWIEEVDFEISTYLSEIRELQRSAPDTAAYDPEAKSAARREALLKLNRYARVPGAPLLILGERGTGKTRLIESFIPPLKGRDNVVSLACGGLDSSLAESLLFGHSKGAFTGANKERAGLLDEANQGILFLDEVQDLPTSIQRKLVRVFQDRKRRFRRIGEDAEREVDVELICASNLSVGELRKRLDDDLFDRLSHLAVEIPPLRKCREDLEEDWSNIWREVRYGNTLPTNAPWSSKMSTLLGQHDLPGNLRDLQRLATLLAAWWSDHPPEQAMEQALKEWESWVHPGERADQRTFGQGTRDERIKQFKSELALWAHEEFGTWETAANELGCNEGTLRKDVIKTPDEPDLHDQDNEITK